MTLPNRKAALLIGLVMLDQFAKVVAYATLPLNQLGDPGGLFRFELAINPTGIGTHARALLSEADVPNPALFGALFNAGMVICLLTLGRLKKLTVWKVLLSCLALVCGLAIVSGFGLLPLVTPEHSVKLLRGAQAVLWCVVWFVVDASLWRLGAALFAAAALGNFFSFLYPPYAIVDFMWSSILRRALGLHVFNLADLMWLLGIAIFGVALVVSLARKVGAQLGAQPDVPEKPGTPVS